MSQPTRADRRRQSRGGAAPPPRRDPMTIVYAAVGVAVVAVIAVFAVMNWQHRQAVVAAYATPTPGASPASSPIPLVDGQPVGKAYFTAKVQDMPKGGLGQPVDGITCGGMEYSTLHIHTHLALFYDGKQLQIPRLIGGAPSAQGGCLYWIHTHFPDGIIHVESPQLEAPEGGPFTLGMLFDIWGKSLGDTGAAGLNGPVVAYVNGTKYDGDLRQIPLRMGQQIVLEVGSPVVPPPAYILPADDLATPSP